MLSIAPQDPPTSPQLGETTGTATAADFGDVPAEFEALRSNSGVYEMPWRAKISFTGSDRVRWLNGIITNNVRDLAAGNGVYAFLLNPQGRILGDLYAYHRGGSLLVDTDRSQLPKILEIFDKYIIMDDVEVADVTGILGAVGIAGPKAVEVLRSAGLAFPPLQPLSFVDLTWRDVSVTVVRGDSPSVESYEVWISPENQSLLLDVLKTSGALPVGTTALNLLRIAEGVPRLGQDIRERDLPQETSQQRALHFTKGCYIGQEIVERIRSRGNVHRMFTGFTVEGPLPLPGAKINVDGKDVGEVTSSASLPLPIGPYHVALGYIRREIATSGKALQIDGTILNVTTLPFSKVFED
ncbi:MAG: YgfZ/GcvT domain-containing protein [Terriglobales bacterium]|jgi:aminomethyltransferase|nr:folate-binding protein [Terriglobales bacterium]